LWLQGSGSVAFSPGKILPIHKGHIKYNYWPLN
jgi:nicotinamide mononucleotide adenylyltransferase